MGTWIVEGVTGDVTEMVIVADTKEEAEVRFVERYPRTFTESMITRESPADGDKATP